MPSFQATLLYHSKRPIFLAPITPSTYTSVYRFLQDSATGPPDPATFRSIHYPSFICAPAPFSHAGHCSPLPGSAPLPALLLQLSRFSYVPHENLFPLPYDWRLSTAQHLQSSLPVQLQNILSEPTIILAHGSGCHFITSILTALPHLKTQVRKLICAAPLPADFSSDALAKGTGILAYADAHVHADPLTNIRYPGRVDFTAMQFELGLRTSRRILLPETEGPWDRNRTFVSTPSERIELAKTFASLREMAKAVTHGLQNVPSICVRGVGYETTKDGEMVDGDGFIPTQLACENFRGTVVDANANHFDLAALFASQYLSADGKGNIS